MLYILLHCGLYMLCILLHCGLCMICILLYCGLYMIYILLQCVVHFTHILPYLIHLKRSKISSCLLIYPTSLIHVLPHLIHRNRIKISLCLPIYSTSLWSTLHSYIYHHILYISIEVKTLPVYPFIYTLEVRRFLKSNIFSLLPKIEFLQRHTWSLLCVTFGFLCDIFCCLPSSKYICHTIAKSRWWDDWKRTMYNCIHKSAPKNFIICWLFWTSAVNYYDRFDSDDIYIYYDEVFVCLSVSKNDHFPLPSWAPEARTELPTRPCRS